MKYKHFIVLIMLLLVVGCNKENNATINNTTIYKNETVESNEANITTEVLSNSNLNLSDKEVKVDGNAKKLLEKLTDKGNELYKNNSYVNFDIVNGSYFISLKELSSKYNFDISNYSNANNCNMDLSGIFFDTNNVFGKNQTVFPMLVGCN